MDEPIDLTNLSILIVDDVKSMRSIMRKTLKGLGIGQVPHVAENGVDALKILHANRIDLAIVDWKMPVMNGHELLESIRNDKHLRDIPVLMVTAESEKDLVLEIAEVEVEGYLLKPVTPSVLEEKIRAVMHQVLHPDLATRHIRKARALEEKEDLEHAIAHLKEAVKLRPKASRHLRNLGLLYEKAGDEAKMVAFLKKAVAVNPMDAVTMKILGDYHWRHEEWAEAAGYYMDVMSLTRKYTDRTIELGSLLLQRGMPGLAQQVFDMAFNHGPRDISIKEQIVDTCIEAEQYEYALRLLKKLMREYPSNYDFAFRAGLIYDKTEQLGKALEYYLQVDKNQFGNLDVKLKLARLFYKNDKIIQADDYLNKVLEKEPDNEEALALRSLL